VAGLIYTSCGSPEFSNALHGTEELLLYCRLKLLLLLLQPLLLFLLLLPFVLTQACCCSQSGQGCCESLPTRFRLRLLLNN